MRLRIDISAEDKRRLRSAFRRAAGPVAGCAAGFLVGGFFGALAGAILGTLVGELFRRSGPSPDEAFLGAGALAGFVATFDPAAEIGGSTGTNALANGFERVALTRIALEGHSGLSKAQMRAFSRLAQGFLSPSASDSADTLLSSYFTQASNDSLPGALCAWALFKSRWPNPERMELSAMRSYLARAGCPEAAASAAEAGIFAERAADWELLGLKPGASREEIKKSFRSLSIAFHPDGLAGIEPEKRKEAAEAFRRVRGAYERLSGWKDESS